MFKHFVYPCVYLFVKLCFQNQSYNIPSNILRRDEDMKMYCIVEMTQITYIWFQIHAFSASCSNVQSWLLVQSLQSACHEPSTLCSWSKHLILGCSRVIVYEISLWHLLGSDSINHCLPYRLVFGINAGAKRSLPSRPDPTHMPFSKSATTTECFITN